MTLYLHVKKEDDLYVEKKLEWKHAVLAKHIAGIANTAAEPQVIYVTMMHMKIH